MGSVNLTWSLNLTTLDDGKHSLKLEINDTDGNQAYDHLVPFGWAVKANLVGKTH